jgi:hypothetical protein
MTSLNQLLTLATPLFTDNATGTLCLVGCFGQGVKAVYPFGGAVDTYTFRGTTGHTGAAGAAGAASADVNGANGVSGVGETWHPSFTYHGFQFVQLDGWPTSAPPPTITTLKKLIVHSDNAPLGYGALPSVSAKPP